MLTFVVDWIGDITDRKSTKGFSIIFGDSIITWKNKKNKTLFLALLQQNMRVSSYDIHNC
ncbi:hypothetical protein MTR_3g116910 [Medicago truncatula]|uniref:Uncharacterized protein n=1 Tax=Medicago truncatula TaxID=3880 RepID=G7J748_MEDTR|nr:hypothetical protein MTR_3g116910 [Medicago truncatula]